MRLEAQAKLGFYPIPPEVTDLILHHLEMPSDPKNRAKVTVIDPCCGEGVALAQIRDGLGIKKDRTYAVELDQMRAAEAKKNLAGSHVLAPASFFGVGITTLSMSLAYCNPPFDHELGGGRREEERFVEKATRLLVPDGILVLVMPINQLAYAHGLTGHIERNYQDIALYSFPADHRRFKEIVVFARRRKGEQIALLSHERFFDSKAKLWDSYRDADPVLGSDNNKYILPGEYVWAPHNFARCDYLDDELAEVFQKSPLVRHLDAPRMPEPRRPLLPLNKGHRALLLASGALDGIVEPEGEEPHVVRGGTTKVDYISEVSEKSDEKGAVTRKTVTSQRPVLTVRIVTSDGNILSLSDEVNTEGDEEAEHHDD